MIARKILIVIIVATLLSAPCFAFNQDVELIDIPLLYEIDGHPDYGFFAEIHSISINEDERALYVLHDTPALLSSFTLEDGIALEKTELRSRVEAPARAEACAGKTWVITDRKLLLLEDDNSLFPPLLGKSEAPLDADFAKCSPVDELLVADSTTKKLFVIPKDGLLLPVDASDIKNKKYPSPRRLFSSITDAAFGPLNKIFMLDRKSGVIRVIDNSGRLLESIILASPTGAQQPWKVSSIAIDGSDNIWAVNTTENALDVYDSFGSLRYRVRDIADDGFEFRFTRPLEILIDNDNRLFLVDDGSFTIKVFDVSELP